MIVLHPLIQKGVLFIAEMPGMETNFHIHFPAFMIE